MIPADKKQKTADGEVTREQNAHFLTYLKKGSQSKTSSDHAGQCQQALEIYHDLSPAEKKKMIGSFFGAGGKAKGLDKALHCSVVNETAVNGQQLEMWVNARAIARHHDVPAWGKPLALLRHTPTTTKHTDT